MKNFLVLMMVLVSIVKAEASGLSSSGTRGGGDEVGLNFQATAAAALSYLDHSSLSPVQLGATKAALENARYIVVDEALFASVAGASYKQNSVALNDKKTRIIYINRERWKALKKPLEKMQIALHELLGLVGLEGTGDYKISSTLRIPDAQSPYPDSRLLVTRFYDNSDKGLSPTSAIKQCALQKVAYQNQYSIVYCSYWEKRIPYTVEKGPKGKSVVKYDLAYGLAIYGVGKKGGSAAWSTVFSSNSFLDEEFGSLYYDTEKEAKYACSLHLIEALPHEPFWLNARCLTAKEANQYFYQIRIQK
ncbi:MAG: hypothetical protein AAGB31_05350 [Bdellovibrio sp.]